MLLTAGPRYNLICVLGTDGYAVTLQWLLLLRGIVILNLVRTAGRAWHLICITLACRVAGRSLGTLQVLAGRRGGVGSSFHQLNGLQELL